MSKETGTAHPRRTQEDRSSTTRGAIGAAARKLFAEHGFAATSIEQILADAGVTRGALYHHFSGKTAVFLTVFEAVEADLTERLRIAATLQSSPWDRLMASAEAFLAACLDPEIRRIVLLDAAAVLGTEEVRRIEEAYTMAGLRTLLNDCARAGDLAVAETPMLAHLILGALAQAATAIARARNPAVARDDAWAAAQTLLSGLRRADREAEPQ